MEFKDPFNYPDKEDNYVMPNPLASSKVKATKGWQTATIDYYINNVNETYSYRKTKADMVKNRNIVSGIVDSQEVKKALDPLGLETSEYDSDFYSQFYNVISQPLDAIYGEELKRQNDIRAIAINPEIVNEKDIIFKQELYGFLETEAQKPQLDEKLLKEKLAELDKWKKYDLQTAHEVMGNQMINIFNNDSELNLKSKYNDGFKNLTTLGESIYRIGNIGIQPTLTVVDSENFYVVGLGKSNLIEDGTAWIEIQYLNPYKIIEEFAEDLTKIQINRILTGDTAHTGESKQRITLLDGTMEGGHMIHTHDMDSAIFPGRSIIQLDGVEMGDTFDGNGNIRVVRLNFISPRKIGKLKYYDSETGDDEYKFVDENYIPIENLGEEVTWFYVNEIWQATRILNDIDLRVKPCDVQMRSLLNPYIVKPPYIGVILTDGKNKAKCIVDKVYQYQIDFNVWMLKLKHLWTTNLGKIGVIDISRMPSNMSPADYMYWLKTFKIAYENPFEEHQKYKGTLAGNMQQNHRVIDLSLTNEIAQAIQMLDWLRQQIEIATAIPKTRQGDMSGNEGLGVTQQSIMQSSNQTEGLFYTQDFIKLRVYTYLLEYTKVLWKDEKVKRQYALDDLSNYLLDIDGELINEAEYGVVMTNGSKMYEMNQVMTQLSHAAIQTGTATLSDVAGMLMSTSPNESLAKLRASEEKRIEQQQESQKMQEETQMKILAKQEELDQKKFEREMQKLAFDRETKMLVENMKLSYQDKMNMDGLDAQDDNNNGVEDQIELDKTNIEKEVKMTVLRSEENRFDKEMRFKEKELATKKDIELAKIKSQKNKVKAN